MANRPGELSREMREGVTANTGVLDLIDGGADLVKTPPNGFGRKARLVFLTSETFLLNRGDQFTVNEDRCRGIAVVRVDSESDVPRHAGPTLRHVRVLLCLPAFVPALDFGGPVTKVRSLALALKERDLDVQVLCSDFGTERTRLGSQRLVVDGITVTYVSRLFARGWLSVPRARVSRSNAFDVDVVHTFGLRDGTVLASERLARSRSIPVVAEPMGMAVPRVRSLRSKGVFDRVVEMAVGSRSDLTIATSEVEALELRLLGYSNVLTRYNPIDIPAGADEPRPTPQFDVCYIGRLHKKKQLTVIVDFLHQTPDTTAVIAGPDEDGTRAVLEDVSHRLGVRERLTLLNWVNPAERSALLRRSRLFVLPSVSENFGNAAAEALALGTPVVTTDACGVADLVATAQAGIVTSTLAAEIIESMQRLLLDAAALAAAGERAAEAVSALSPSQIADQQVEIYRQVCENQ